ncbi:hypothetical protein [Caballeronia sp. AZ10_KS36]|uniref:hypothetical protein n=1 Tax=Caballeronia sp. AZ10_KS36 TaxID=2921757 RepID=UPI002028BD77|nr:hypothetical protein [Caballeronia sp. AZ10_KS36]
MKRFAGLTVATLFFLPPAWALDGLMSVGLTPAIGNTSPGLKKALRSLTSRTESDGRECLDIARNMETKGNYDGSLTKMVDNEKILGLQVSGSKMCDGVHSSTYRYGVAFEKASGKPVDLAPVYQIAIRKDNYLFLRPELVDSTAEVYRQVNAGNPSCLDNPDLLEGLANFSADIRAGVRWVSSSLLFCADVSTQCFPILHLHGAKIKRFRDALKAARYGLP